MTAPSEPRVVIVETLLIPTPGFRSDRVARFLWQMDDQRRRLTEETRGLSPADLEWQPRPGMNSRGMLLAHIAYAETHLGQVGVLGEATSHPRDVIGIGEEEEGLPLASGAPPSPALAGKPLEWFDDLLARARAHTRSIAANLTDADLEHRILRPPREDGTRRAFNMAWVFYHLIEHEGGHRAQINLLTHLHKAMRG